MKHKNSMVKYPILIICERLQMFKNVFVAEFHSLEPVIDKEEIYVLVHKNKRYQQF